MLRKIKPTNTIKAVAVIAILVTSLLAIQVQGQGQEDQQGEENQRQGPGGLISPQGSQMMSANHTMALCGQQCLHWNDQVVYTRLVLVAFQANATEDFNASYTRLLRNAELLGNASQSILGQAESQNLTTLLKIHDQIYVQILNQTRLNDTAALNNSLTMWYENAAQIVALYNNTMSRASSEDQQAMPDGNRAQWRLINITVLAGVKEYLDVTLLEVNEYMQGNYSGSITHFDRAKSLVHNLLFKICMSIMTIPPELATTTITKTRTTTETITKTTTKTKTLGSTNTTTTTGNTTTTTTNTTTTTTNTTTTHTNVTTTIMVSIVNGAGNDTSSPGYSPDSVTIVVGVNNTVKWTNNDSVDHTVTSTDVPSGATSFDSGPINPGDTFTKTFTVPGTYHYHCSLHSWMNGTIIVEEP